MIAFGGGFLSVQRPSLATRKGHEEDKYNFRKEKKKKGYIPHDHDWGP